MIHSLIQRTYGRRVSHHRLEGTCIVVIIQYFQYNGTSDSYGIFTPMLYVMAVLFRMDPRLLMLKLSRNFSLTKFRPNSYMTSPVGVVLASSLFSYCKVCKYSNRAFSTVLNQY